MTPSVNQAIRKISRRLKNALEQTATCESRARFPAHFYETRARTVTRVRSASPATGRDRRTPPVNESVA